jgi:hypothetical protein
MSSSSSETVQVDPLRAAREEVIVSEAPTWGNMVESSTLMGVTGDSVSPCIDSGLGNEVTPRFVGASGRATLTFGSSRGPHSNPSQKANVGDTPLAPRSFDVMALGNEGDTALAPGSSDVVALGNVALGLPGFP